MPSFDKAEMQEANDGAVTLDLLLQQAEISFALPAECICSIYFLSKN